MVASPRKNLIVACGALAKEIVYLAHQFGQDVELKCLPAGYHNNPERIVPALKAILDDRAADFDSILIGYGDCGTGGGLDRLLEHYPNAERLPGAHCYAFYAGLQCFDELMEDEVGTFFLTDYLVRHFDTLIMKGMGLDRYPHLQEDYFGNYKKLTYLSQQPDAGLIAKGKDAALQLGLLFEHKPVGFGQLSVGVSSLHKGAQSRELVNV